MIENMILQGLAGGVGMEHPTSVSYSNTDGLILGGITKAPFCILFSYIYSASGTLRITEMYLKNPADSSVIMNIYYRRSSDASTSSTTFSSVTYTASSNEVKMKPNSSWLINQNYLPTTNDVYCIY